SDDREPLGVGGARAGRVALPPRLRAQPAPGRHHGVRRRADHRPHVRPRLRRRRARVPDPARGPGRARRGGRAERLQRRHRAPRVRCAACALRYPRRDGVYLLGPPFAVNVAGRTFASDRMRRLAADAHAAGWDVARQRFAAEVLAGTLRAPEQSRWARLRAKVAGTTWEDTLQDLVDPTRAGRKFLLNLRSNACALFLGPSQRSAPVILARSAAHVVVLDGSVERLRLVHEQAAAAGL